MQCQNIVRILYRKLISLYPQGFGGQLGESMEQTFNDLWNEKRQTKKGLFGFVLWMFIDTAIGIFREHLLLIPSGHVIQTMLKTIESSALISFLLILPFPIMEVINRRNFNGDFPSFLFLVMWLSMFAIILIVWPIARARRTGNDDMASPTPTHGNTLLTNPKSSAILSVMMILFLVLVAFLGSIQWEPLDRLFNGTDPEVAYFPGQVLALGLILFPVMAGIIAGRPIVNTLRAGGSLFAHPIHLIIIVFILSNFAIGLGSLIIDQWPCFMGVPQCD